MMALPDCSATAQKEADGHETEEGPLPTASGSMVTEADHDCPFQANATPQWSTTEQYELVGQEIEVMSPLESMV